MFLKLFYYFTLIFLLTNSWPVFSSSFCGLGFSFFKSARPHPSERGRAVTGIESYRETVIRLAKSSLKVKDLSVQQIKALETYHRVVQGEMGIDGSFAKVGNYTVFQTNRIVQFLQRFFSSEQVTVLIEDGVVEIRRMELKVSDKTVLGNLDEGEFIFIMDSTKRDLRVSTTRTSIGVRKINKILEQTDSSFLVEVEKIDSESGQVIKEELLIEEHNDYFLGNPETENIFLAVQSTRKKISSHDLHLPFPTNKERELKEQGYKASYIAGIDKVNEWASLRRQLQELRANPYRTHIEYFAHQVPYHIAHIRKGLVDYYSASNKLYSLSSQLRGLRQLEKEAKRTVSNKGVTYKWWLEFNFRLANVMSGGGSYINAIPSLIKKNMLYISYFPLQIILPTIEDIGIMTFNRAEIEGLYPASLINNRTAKVAGYEPTPLGFFIHDFDHAGFRGNQVHLEYSVGHFLFHKRLMDSIENLPFERREKAEAIYFTVTHENPGKNISYNDEKEVIKTVKYGGAYNRELFNHLDDSSSHGRQERKVLVDTFMEVYNRTLQHQ